MIGGIHCVFIIPAEYTVSADQVARRRRSGGNNVLHTPWTYSGRSRTDIRNLERLWWSGDCDRIANARRGIRALFPKQIINRYGHRRHLCCHLWHRARYPDRNSLRPRTIAAPAGSRVSVGGRRCVHSHAVVNAKRRNWSAASASVRCHCGGLFSKFQLVTKFFVRSSACSLICFPCSSAADNPYQPDSHSTTLYKRGVLAYGGCNG